MKNPVFSPADILLPKNNFEKWSVIACDQFTSRPDYWEECSRIAGDSPSALRLIYPEAFLGEKDRSARIDSINGTMREYLDNGIYNEYKNAFIYVERIQSDGRRRCGLVGKTDLEQYDYSEDSHSAIRATEKTVLERLPPRVEIRKGAPTELPHIMMLADDPNKTVIEPITALRENGELEKLYDFELMQGGGHLSGWLVPEKYHGQIVNAIDALGKGREITLAVGDGNHSLATAKACHELMPTEINRYALAEVINLHSDALEFEPIYRVAENVDPSSVLSAFKDFLEACGAKLSDDPLAQSVNFVSKDTNAELHIQNPPHSLAVGTVQLFLDSFMGKNPDAMIDYIHGEEEVISIAGKDNSCGFLYGGIEKSELFPAVEKSGTLPRKTFSMGHARDKRYYTEVRKIK